MLTLQLITSFIAGGIFIALQTLVAERVNPRYKGLILTIPTTMALGLLFIGLVKSPADVVEAATIIPSGLGIDYIFVTIFALLIPFGLLISLAGAFAAWAISAYLLITHTPATFLISFIYEVIIVTICYLIVLRMPKVAELKKYPMNFKHIALRSVLGGIIIFLVVLLSKTLGNIWGGLFSVFPAAFTSTFIIYYYLQDKKAVQSVARSLFFPGIIGFNIYCFIAMLTFPQFGIWIGTLAAYIATFAFFYIWNFVLNRKTF